MINDTLNRVAPSLTRLGQLVSRYGLVIVLAWIGFGKYVKMESRVLIEHSPLMSWIYDFLSVATVARGLGTMEIVAALLIALRPAWPRASASRDAGTRSASACGRAACAARSPPAAGTAR